MAVRLRDVTNDDSPTIYRWRNLPDVARYMYTDHAISEEEHRQWFRTATTDPTRRYWIIETGGDPVGLANIYDIDVHHKRAEWAFYIADPRLRGRGIGARVEYQVICFAFDELDLHRLTCAVLDFNKPTIAMHEKFGFVREGTKRQHIRKSEGFVDVVLLGMLRDEWERQRERFDRMFA